MQTTYRLRHNAAKHRYEFDLGDAEAFVEYVETPRALLLVHTEVPPRYEGRGIGGKLVRAVLEELRERGVRIVPQCSFIAIYIRRHPEFAAMVDA